MRQPRLRILHALGSLDPGGVEMWLLNVVRHIDRDRFQFDFCTFGLQPGLCAGEAEKLGSKILRCPKGANLWDFGRRFRRILREGNYDVVHSHVHLFSGVVLRWTKAEGVPMRIAHSHTSQDDKPDTYARRGYRKLMRSWIAQNATHGLAASRLCAAELFGQDWERDSRCRVLHCGIDLRPFEEPIVREEVRQELGIPPDATVVGHVGRFVGAKNHRFLLEIAGEISKREPDIHFLFVGDGPLRPEIEARAAAMGFNGNMHFAGNRSDVPRLMRGGMDVFVFPSLWEGLPMALIEAQAAGLYSCAAPSVTTEATVEQEAVTFMNRSATSGDWAEEVIRLSNGRRMDGHALLAAVEESSFSVLRSIERLARIYQGDLAQE